jgi:hypothetical protein
MGQECVVLEPYGACGAGELPFHKSMLLWISLTETLRRKFTLKPES